MSPTVSLVFAEKIIMSWLSEIELRFLGRPTHSESLYTEVVFGKFNVISGSAMEPQAEQLLIYSDWLPTQKTKAFGGKWVSQVHLMAALWHRCSTVFSSLLYLHTKLMFYYRHWWLRDAVAFTISGSSPRETNTLRCQKYLFDLSSVHLFISVNLITLFVPTAVYMGNKLSIYQHFKIFHTCYIFLSLVFLHLIMLIILGDVNTWLSSS